MYGSHQTNHRFSLAEMSLKFRPAVGLRLLTSLFTALCFTALCSTNAQAETSFLKQIAAAAAESSDQLSSEKISDVDAAKQQLMDSVAQVRRHLDQTTTESNAAAWLNYLQVEQLVTAIESGERDSEIAKLATEVTQQATGIHPGLEIPAIMQLRSAADRYSDALRFQKKDNTTKLLAALMGQISKQWGELQSQPSPDQVARLSLLLDLLNRTNQDTLLAKTASEQFANSNLNLVVRESLIHSVLNRRVEKCSSVQECILGTRIVGSALIMGNVTTDLLESDNGIRLRVALDGTVSSNNRGYNGPVKLRTSGFGNVHASRVLNISDTGIQYDPVFVDGYLSTRINAIEHPLRLVRKIARKKAAQQKPVADRIAHRKFVSRITSEFEKETQGAIGDPIPELLAKARPYLQRLNLDEPKRKIRSTDDAIHVSATLRTGPQLAAPTPPPAAPKTSEAIVQIHESVIGNTIGAILAGRSMTKSELDTLAAKVKPPQDQESSADAEEEPDFEIDFDRTRPIIFEARDGNIRLGVRGTRFAQGARELKNQLEIVAVYKPSKQGDKLIFERDGEVQINFPGTKRLSVGQAGLRGAIKQGFADAFPQQLLDQPLIIPADAKLESARGLEFGVNHFSAQDGWLSVGIRQL